MRCWASRRLRRSSRVEPGGFLTGSVYEIMESMGDPHAWGSDYD